MSMFDNGYSVRDAHNYEVFELVEICREVLQESVTYRHMDFNKEKSANYMMDGILKRPNTFMRVIVDSDDKPVGGMMCVSEVAMFSNDKVAYDVTIMIDKAHRGRCIRQLIKIIEEYKQWATDEGCKIIKMGVSSGLNIDKAAQFFEHLGFERIGSMHGLRVGV